MKRLLANADSPASITLTLDHLGQFSKSEIVRIAKSFRDQRAARALGGTRAAKKKTAAARRARAKRAATARKRPK
jgi:hypothetical protein